MQKNSLRHFLNIRFPGSDHTCGIRRAGADRAKSVSVTGSLRTLPGQLQEPVKAQVAQTRKQGLERVTPTQEHSAGSECPEIQDSSWLGQHLAGSQAWVGRPGIQEPGQGR